MAISTREAREQILSDLGESIAGIGLAFACLGEAYEQVSVTAADRLEDQLYRPVQRAFGRAKRAHAQFAERAGIEVEPFETPSPGRVRQGARSFVERAVEAAEAADRGIADIQDSEIALEAGDAELRAGLSEVREELAKLPGAAREFLRTLGR